mgnify:CR=1 FL=1
MCGQLMSKGFAMTVYNRSRGKAQPLVDRGALRVVGAVYSLDTGKVEWLPESPAKAIARLEMLRESVQCLRSH